MRRIDRGQLKEELSRLHWAKCGRVVSVVGTVIEADIPDTCVGATMRFGDGELAEVVGFRKERALLLPYGPLRGVGPGTLLSQDPGDDYMPAGSWLLGRIFDPFLNCLSDSSFRIPAHSGSISLEAPPINPLKRERIREPLPLGIRSIDAMLTMGRGQRLGIMAGSGVGKSVLLGMIAQGSAADVNVIGMIGERGREVREFVERELGPEGLRKSVVISVTSDHSPLLKVRAAKMVHSVAEYFSKQGREVLLMLDSLTRVAMAQREVGLAVGEPPTSRGYTPSVFSMLPRLLERSGPQEAGRGAISALYTVLVDGDDFNDPVTDAARSILDGQINLTRRLADRGHYPAIDIPSSISRVMVDIQSPEHRVLAQELKELIAVYDSNIDLIQIGAYQSGANALLDRAVQMMPRIERFLRQDVQQKETFASALQSLENLLKPQKTNVPYIVESA